MKNDIPKDKLLILFDGVCNLCNSSVLYVIKHDKKDKFLFAPIQSKTGDEIIKEFNINIINTDSILLYNPAKNTILCKSNAALKIGSQLGFPLILTTIFYIFPKFIRNWVYDIVAKNRYKWFGRKDTCMIPTPELESRFLS